MKKAIGLLLLALVLMTVPAGCGQKNNGLSEIKEYFYETDTYTSLDYDFANDYFAKTNDNWDGGCSAISAVIDGERLVGRNMDLNISNKCAYVVRTKVPGKYETFGLAYTFRDISPDYDEVKKEGISDEFRKILPFMCDDVMNSEGLHIEINMRHGEQDAEGNDLFGVEHTNAAAPERIYVFNLGQYVALNCKNLEEVKRYLAEDVDVYNQKNYWNYCFVVTDAGGNSALLEFGNGKYYWTEPDENGIVAQANFYINKECSEMEDVKTGLGRYDTMMKDIKGVTSKSDLYEMMKKISYYNFYSKTFDDCKENHFDPRSELIGEVEGLTYDLMMSPENEKYIKVVIDALHAPYYIMSRQEKQDLNELWESTFTEVVSPAERMIEVRLFENEGYLYRITFDGVEEISEIK